MNTFVCFLKMYKLKLHRNFSISKHFKQNVEKVKPNETKHQEFELGNLQHVKPSNWEKYLLIYSKKYKSFAEIPDRISSSTIDRAKSVVRIKLANIIMVFMLLACIGYVYVGKKRAEEGDTSIKRALEYKEKYLASLKKDEKAEH